MTHKDLERLEELAKKAAPGPWKYLRGGHELPGLKDGWASIETTGRTRYVLKGIASLRPDDSVRTGMTQGKAEDEWANAEFIAALSPEVVLELIGLVRDGISE